MDEIGPVDFGAALMDWALHEWHGRVRVGMSPESAQQAAALSPELTRWNAARALLTSRKDIIAGLMHAGTIRCTKVRVTGADIPTILVMGADPAANYSKNKLAERDVDGSANYVRGLAASAPPVGGAFLAIGRTAAVRSPYSTGCIVSRPGSPTTRQAESIHLRSALCLRNAPSPVFELAAAE